MARDDKFVAACKDNYLDIVREHIAEGIDVNALMRSIVPV